MVVYFCIVHEGLLNDMYLIGLCKFELKIKTVFFSQFMLLEYYKNYTVTINKIASSSKKINMTKGDD